jgi:LCP family protein required for cell wall assembly
MSRYKTNRNSSSRNEMNHASEPSFEPRHRKPKRSFSNFLYRSALVILVVIIVSALFVEAAKSYYMRKIDYVPPPANPTIIDENGSTVTLSDVATETTVIPLPQVDGVHNILLIGTDSRYKKDKADGSGHLADIIMILTVNENDNSLKLTSIQRDNLVYIPGYTDPQKINSAMTYGGPELLMLVIENSLRIDLSEYAFVNMSKMERVVDAVGGVTVNVSEEERTNVLGGLNELVAEQNEVFGSPLDSNLLLETGNVKLNGRQAVAYSRIRKVGNGDYDRSKRQVEVLRSLMTRFMNMSFTSKVNVLDDILSLITTNIDQKSIEWYALTFLPEMENAEFEYKQIPFAGYSNSGMYYDLRTNGEWSIRTNWNGMIPLFYQYIYGETFAFDPVEPIPEAPVATPTPTPMDEDTKPGGSS